MEKKQENGNCCDCYSWDSVNYQCKSKQQNPLYKTVFADNTCDLWKKLKSANDKEKERRQLADHYVPNMWDEWKKKALLKESQNKIWEI